MLNFRKLKLNDKQLIDKYVNDGETGGSAYSFGTLFAWGDSYQMEIAEHDNMLLMRGCDDGQPYYVYPSGTGDVKAAVDAMIEDNKNNNCVFMLGQLLEENVEKLKELYDDEFDYFFSRDYSEYVYLTENMANLPGKKFHAKKNHINAFFRKHTDIHIDPITTDNIHHCLQIQNEWLSERSDANDELERENLAIAKAVENFTFLNFVGAILYADGKPIAFTMGEGLKNGTFCTHYEKALPDYRDAFPVINNGFTKLMLQSYKYVNREEDAGSEGLRKAKLSYYPEFLVKKYTAMFKNDVMRKYYVDKNDKQQLKELWMKVFDDSEATVDFFINNAVNYGDVYAHKIDGKIVSAFYLVDGVLTSGVKTQKIKYLYAAATLPEFRKQGIMADMIKYAVQLCTLKEYAAVVLCPADEHLYEYYGKLGFESKISERKYVFDSDSLRKYKGARYFNSSVAYDSIRKTIPSASFVDFVSGYLDYARYLAADGGFEISVVFDDEDSVFAIGYFDDGNAVVQEAISSDGNYEHVLNVLADIDAEHVILKTPECIIIDGFAGKVERSGMILPITVPITDDNIYLGQPCI